MKAKILLLITIMMMAFTGPALLPSAAAYADCNSTTSKKEAVEALGQAPGAPCDDSGVTKLISAIVSILSLVVGMAAIIMIILAGFKYITSGGDSGKIGSAKNTLIYALVGLFIAALAQFLVHFVLTTAESSADPCPAGQTRSAKTNKCEDT